MVRNIQEYINGLINRDKIFYLDLNNTPSKIENKCRKCSQKLEGKTYCSNLTCSPRQLTGEITDLSYFNNLRGINASNNQITSLDFLNTLPSKDKLKSLNLFGNQIKEVDFAELFTNFPKLEKINLTGNPLSAKNLNKLTDEQFCKLIDRIKDGKMKINSFKGTVLMDLLEYAQELAKKGNTDAAAYLQTLIKQEIPSKPVDKQSNDNNPLLIGGLAITVISALAIGYFWGKRKKVQN